jgi:hypothetical protein
MAIQSELVAPISVDLRAEDLSFDIVKGIEHINYQDGKQDDSTASFAPGDWATKTSTGFAVPATGNAVGNVYPVVTGNNQYDSLATGNLTVAVGGGFMYKTNKFVAGSYTIGQNLCVKNLGGGEKVPSAAGSNDAIVARVYDYDSVKGIMTILVLNR